MRNTPNNVRRKLSAGFVAALKTTTSTRQVYYDTDPPCFGVEVRRHCEVLCNLRATAGQQSADPTGSGRRCENEFRSRAQKGPRVVGPYRAGQRPARGRVPSKGGSPAPSAHHIRRRG